MANNKQCRMAVIVDAACGIFILFQPANEAKKNWNSISCTAHNIAFAQKRNAIFGVNDEEDQQTKIF